MHSICFAGEAAGFSLVLLRRQIYMGSQWNKGRRFEILHTPATFCFKPNDSKEFDNKTLIAIARQSGHAVRLDIGGFENLTDEALVAVSEHCPGLTSLDVGGCWNLTDEALVAVSKKCPGLTSLNVEGCWNLTDAAVVTVSEHCPGLTSLDVGRCSNLTDAAVVAVSKKCPNLTSLKVYGSPNLTLPDAIRDEGTEAILRYYRQLNKASLKSESAKQVSSTQVNQELANLPDAAWLDNLHSVEVALNAIRREPHARRVDIAQEMHETWLHDQADGENGLTNIQPHLLRPFHDLSQTNRMKNLSIVNQVLDMSALAYQVHETIQRIAGDDLSLIHI